MRYSEFDPCTDGKCTGRDRSGWDFHECMECKVARLEREISSLEFRIRNELEPRIKAERRAYDVGLSQGGKDGHQA